jgi:hypothetical protein
MGAYKSTGGSRSLRPCAAGARPVSILTPMDPHPRRWSALIAVALALCVSSCRVPLKAALEDEPWAATDAGNWGMSNRMGLFTNHEAVSGLSFESNGGPVNESFTSDLIGLFGFAVGAEYFVAKDVSLVSGIDFRVLEPERTPGLVFDQLLSTEFFLALRWVLPYRWGEEGRWRTFLETKFAVIPTTRFDFELDLGVPGTANPELNFRGDPYTTIGLSSGVLYQLNDRAVAHLAAVYEWPLDHSEDIVTLNIANFTIPMRNTIEPEGLIVFGGVTFYF